MACLCIRIVGWERWPAVRSHRWRIACMLSPPLQTERACLSGPSYVFSIAPAHVDSHQRLLLKLILIRLTAIPSPPSSRSPSQRNCPIDRTRSIHRSPQHLFAGLGRATAAEKRRWPTNHRRYHANDKSDRGSHDFDEAWVLVCWCKRRNSDGPAVGMHTGADLDAKR